MTKSFGFDVLDVWTETILCAELFHVNLQENWVLASVQGGGWSEKAI